MQRRLFAVALSATILWLAGCSADSNSGPNPTVNASTGRTRPSLAPLGVAEAPPTESAAAQPQPPPATPPLASTKPPAAQPQPPLATTSLASESHRPAAGEQSINLSVGIALPQPGLDGTLMTFSVDYEFTHGEPNSSAYVWVIERAHGAPAKKSVQLTKEGNLASVIKGWHPEDGPFRTHIEDPSGHTLSARIELQ